MKNSNFALTKRWFPINNKALQNSAQIKMYNDFIKNKYRNYIIAAGRRSFKTERFAKRLLVWQICSKQNYGKYFFAGAPTYAQAKAIFWDDIKQLIPPRIIKKISESELKIEITAGAVLKIIGLKEFRRLQGQLLHGIVISEYQDCDPDVYSQSVEPMVNDTRGWCIKEGRPLGKNHFYEDFIKAKQNLKGWAAYHWKSEEILSDEQIDEAKRNLTKYDYEREYNASFETQSQRPYYSYSEKNNKCIEYAPHLPVIVACDFNAQEKPMCWLIGQVHVINNIKTTFWLKEFSLQYTNTLTMCSIIDEDYFMSLNNQYPEKIIFYGDYAGVKYTSNSSYSDWDIIKKFFADKTEIELCIKPCSSVRDSIASTNAQLCNAKGEIRQFVNPLQCKELIKDWEFCSWKSNGRELEDKNPLRGHLCRAVDYYNDYEFPVRSKFQTSNLRLL